MSCPIGKEALDQLKQFITVCRLNSDILHLKELEFFKNFIESFGGKIPEAKKSEPTSMPSDTETANEKEKTETVEETVESDAESELELDMTGCIEPDIVENQTMGDPKKEVSEEDSDKADEKRIEAVSQFAEGNFQKSIELYSEAIEINPTSALLFAKRGQVYLKLNKPNACIKDCTRALELNCDSATAYKFRGKAYRLLGKFEEAAKDLRQACNIDFDEQTDEWLKEVTPNAQKIEQHLLKYERKKLEKEEKEKMERVRKAKEAYAKASNKEPAAAGPQGAAGPETTDFYKLLQDPEVMAAFQDPEVAAAFQDISMNFTNFLKYKDNPKVMDLIKKLSNKFPGAGAGFPGFPAGFPGMNPTASSKPSDDDHLD